MSEDIFYIDICVKLFPSNAIIQYLYPRFRLAFSPALYKFIVRALWAWVHSYSGFKSNLVLTIVNVIVLIYIYIDTLSHTHTHTHTHIYIYIYISTP